MSGATGQPRDDPANPGDDDGPAPEVVCVDVGEVLVDETRVWSVWAGILGVSPFTLHAVIGAAIVQGEPHTSALPFVAPNIDWQDLRDEHERVYGGFEAADLYPDAAPCLRALHGAGFGVVVAGNQPAARRGQLLALDLAADVVTTSDDLGAAKPDAAFFAALMELVGERFGVGDPGRVLYVGDRVDNDVLPALDFGMRTCWLRRGPWGRLHGLPGDAQPDLVLEGLGELPELLTTWRGAAGDQPH